MARRQEYVWRPQEGPQLAAVECPIEEIFFGGARGGGKTDASLGRACLRAIRYGKDYTGYFLRKELIQLEAAIKRSKQIFGPFATFHEQKKIWQFKNGAWLQFRYIEKDKDAEALQGSSATDVMIEELGNFEDLKPLLKLKGILRSVGGVPISWFATGNPGGRGQAGIKRRYIDPDSLGWKVIKEQDEFTGLLSERVYIPSRITDNKLLLKNDPGYLSRLAQTGSEGLVRAWLDGDFNAIEDAYFPEWNAKKHVLEPFDIPKHWLRFCSMDHGSYYPSCIGWYAVATEDFFAPNGSYIPKDALVKYRELYTSKDDNNEGMRIDASDLGRLIARHDFGETERIRYRVLDPKSFSSDGGPSVAERMARATNGKVRFRRADNKRVGADGAVGGWDLLRQRLKGHPTDIPGLYVPAMYFFSTCKAIIRTIGIAEHDKDHPEDLSLAEDHALDETRYAVMSRPYAAHAPAAPELMRDVRSATLNDLWAVAAREKRKRKEWRV